MGNPQSKEVDNLRLRKKKFMKLIAAENIELQQAILAKIADQNNIGNKTDLAFEAVEQDCADCSAIQRA